MLRTDFWSLDGTTDTLAELKTFLETCGYIVYQEDEHNRVLKFNANGTPCSIIWFINDCTLRIGDCMEFPFRKACIDNCYPSRLRSEHDKRYQVALWSKDDGYNVNGRPYDSVYLQI